MKHLYSFISYNRRVIIPAEKFEAKNSCTPDFKTSYRVAFITFSWLVISWILNSYSSLLVPLIPSGGFYREMMICGGQIFFQSIVVSFIAKEKLMHYLGNMMAISLGGALILLPALWFSYTGLITSEWFYVGWFMMTAGLTLLEHIRRMKIIGIHWLATITWIFYRIIVLSLILYI